MFSPLKKLLPQLVKHTEMWIRHTEMWIPRIAQLTVPAKS